MLGTTDPDISRAPHLLQHALPQDAVGAGLVSLATFLEARDQIARAHGRVPLDKSEGGVKDKSILSVFLAPLFCQRGLRTKTLEISR